MRLECSDSEASDRPVVADVLLRQEPEQEEEEEDEGDGNEGGVDDKEDEDGYSE
jgi:hypothetical protein